MVIVLYGGICLDKGVRIGGTGGFCLVNDGFGQCSCMLIRMAAVCCDGHKIESLDIFSLDFLATLSFCISQLSSPWCCIPFHWHHKRKEMMNSAHMLTSVMDSFQIVHTQTK